ncbi:MAG: hypothetical protein IJG88_04485, partial [Eggerthellaceae bacterium]|nr:hypothetical protein [Eggerthellaceae bacterium]
EFVALLRGNDYAARNSLMTLLEDSNHISQQTGGVLIAGGIADYRFGEDQGMESVLQRARLDMHHRKQEMKQAQES